MSASAPAPSARMRRRASSPRPRVPAVRTSRQRPRLSARAVSSPMPPVAPVTRTVLPARADRSISWIDGAQKASCRQMVGIGRREP
ncbi:hypothetical protein CDD83_5069 [Cordyceps sp. RAO-2017]|nr:hypothetical protein CDD83_5069 [Cordyceps sp. RAO-2017]